MKKAAVVFFAVSMIAAAAFAEGHGGGPGGPGGLVVGPEGGLTVGSDGSVYITSVSVTNNVATTTIKAVRSTGTVAWTASITGHPHITLSGSNILTLSDATSDGTITSTITAISTLTGSTAWTRTITGRVDELRPFSGGTYAEVVVPPATSGGTATRSLVAIGNDGATLWTLTL